MDIKFHAVRIMLQRANPALPPRTRCGVGKAQRRLDMAFEIATFVAARCGHDTQKWADWGAEWLLDVSTSGDPLWHDLGNRLARVVYPYGSHWLDDRLTSAWMSLYTIADSSRSCGYAPRGWEVTYPQHAITSGVVCIDASTASDRLFAAAAAVDGSFTYEPGEIYSRITPVPGQCLTAGAVKLINRLAKGHGWHDPGDGSPHVPLPLLVPRWERTGEVYRDYDLARLAALRMHADSGRLDAAQRIAHTLGRMANRSWWSGHITGTGFSGSSRRCETSAHEVSIVLDSWADNLDDVTRYKITSAIAAGVRGVGLPQQACRDALLPIVI